MSPRTDQQIPLFFSVVVALAVLLGAGSSRAEDGAAIMQRVDAAQRFMSAYSEMSQTIVTTGGQKRTLVSRSWSVRDGENQLVEYTAPADIRGQKILMTDDGDNIWMFNPETRRTRRLGSHMRNRRVMGSDFTYEDQMSGDMSSQYTARVLRRENQGGSNCHVLELIPTEQGPSYGKVLAWVGVDDSLIRRMDYYQERDAQDPFKRLLLEDIRAVGSHRVAHRLTMRSLVRGTSTVAVINRIQFSAEIPESIFESRNLSR